MSKRDEQFKGFAKLLFDELYDQFNNLIIQESDSAYEARDKEAEQTRKGIQENIAQKAYDLVWYTVENAREYCLEDTSTKDIVSYIEDMTEWPTEPEA